MVMLGLLFVPVEFGADGGGEIFGMRGGIAEEGDDGGELPFRVGDEGGVVDFKELDVFPLAELGEGLIEVGLLGLDEVVFFGAGFFAVAGEHGPLGIDDFRDRALHEEDAVVVLGRELGEEGGDDFDDFSLGLLDEAGVFAEGFDVLPFEVALEVVFIGRALAIGHGFHAGGGEHLHHQGGAGAREAGDDGEGGGLDGVFLCLLAGGFLALALALGVAGLGTGGDAAAEGFEFFPGLSGFTGFEADGVGFGTVGFVIFPEGAVNLNERLGGWGVVFVEAEGVEEGVLGFAELVLLEQGLAEDGVGAEVAEVEGDGFEGEIGGGGGVL